MTTVPVTVAVVSWNDRQLLAACLRSLKSEVDAGRADVWVVDNASTDGSPQMVRDDFPWVSLIASSENRGYGPAINLVAARTQTPWLAAANQDVELTAGALEALLQAGEADGEAAVVAPRLLLPDGSTQHSVHPFPTLWLALLFNLGLHRLSHRLGDRLTIEGYWDPMRPRRVDWAIAAFVLIRRPAFEAVGGFDDNQWIHAEDLGLAWRLSDAGWSTRHEPTAAVRHVGSTATTKAFGDDLTARWMAATYAWIATERSVPVAWATATINLLGAGVRYLAFRALARICPGRWSRLRDSFRHWVRIHRAGLRPRTDLLRRY